MSVDVDLSLGIREPVRRGKYFETEACVLGMDNVIIGDGQLIFLSEDIF